MAILTSSRNEQEDQLFELTEGIAADSRLAAQEIIVQKAWARALAKAGVLSAVELNLLDSTLEEALKQMLNGNFAWDRKDEDIHMNLERFVTEKIGDLGKRMHSGRSRNDLIATTLRLYVNESLRINTESLRQLTLTIVRKSNEWIEIIVPGLTHLQHGQPVRFGHAFSAYGWAFERDLERLKAASHRCLSVMPLGSAALSGTSLNMDLETLAKDLGFLSPPKNSYDQVGDRDFLLEALDAFASVTLHLSRLSEDLIYWSSTAVGLIRLPKNWSTGSSIMPNKRNPDVPELIRAKAAHIIGASVEARLLVKGLPTCYNSDFHELKSIFLRAHDELTASLKFMGHFVSELEVDKRKAEGLLAQGHILATEIADHLSAKGLAFREAYKIVAALVELADQKGVQVEQLHLAEAQKVDGRIDWSFLSRISAESAVEKRAQSGGTSRARLRESLTELQDKISHF